MGVTPNSDLSFEALAGGEVGPIGPAQWNDALKCWAVAEPGEVLDALRDGHLVTPSIVPSLQATEERFGIQLENLRYIASFNPLLNEGQVHADMRRSLAVKLTARRTAILARLDEAVAVALEPLFHHQSVDLMQVCLLPLVDQVAAGLAGLDTPIPFPVLSVTRIFDRLSPVSGLVRAEEALGHIRSVIRERGMTDSEQEILTLLILGRDSLLSSLGASLATAFEQMRKSGTEHLTLTSPYPSTGVAVAERVAQCPHSLGQVSLAADDRVRIYLQPLNGIGGATLPIFGAGAHACLGRMIALDVWNAMTECLAGGGLKDLMQRER